MKKAAILLILAAMITGGAFGQMSFGAGFIFDYSANNGSKSEILDVKKGMINTSFGGFAFFDISYIEINASITYGRLKPYVKGPDYSYYIAQMKGLKMTQLGLSVYGKYPLSLGKISLYPMIGAEFNIALTVKDENGNELEKYQNSGTRKPFKEYSQWGFLGGVGLDIPFTSKIFLRTEALFLLRIPSKDTRNNLENSFTATYGIGPRIKVGIGYKL